MNRRAVPLLLSGGLLTLSVGFPAPAPASDPVAPEGSELAELHIFPGNVRLESARDRQRVVVVATAADGTHRDVTAQVSFGLGDPGLASIEDGVLRPTADGQSELIARFDGRSVSVPLEVLDAAVDPATSFRLDVLPVVTARGCNTGGCHGSARGRDGFRLSLFGFDPAGDHWRITRELPGRRLNRAFPASSLLLEKPSGAVPHTGGRRFAPDSESWHTLLRWIEAGAPDDGDDVATVTGLELTPPEVLLAGEGQEMGLVVRARYSDGTDRDVTDLTVFRTNNETCARIDASGRLHSGTPGEAFVTASFGVHTVGMPVVVLPEGAEVGYADPASEQLAANYVDEAVERKHRKLRINPSPLCSDEEFLRRAHLDITGLLPTPEERAAFLEDERDSGEKRAARIDELIERPEFSEQWVMKWAELLGIRSSNEVSVKAALLYYEWVRDRIAENTPVDEMVRRILTASGGTFTAPQTNYYQLERDNLVLAEKTAQAFLGIRIQCAQCHNHPFDRWTQDDYYGFASFFAQVGRKQAEDPDERIIHDRGSGSVKHAVGGRVMEPRFLGGGLAEIEGRDRRAVLAQWLTAPDNPWFARSLANRVWAHFMGPGIVEPVDDLRVSNPPSNAPLLDALAKRLVESGYDFKALVRDICGSRAYQRSTRTTEQNAHDLRNYASAHPRRLRAETLLDVVCQVTGVPEKLKGLPLGARAVQIADGSTSTYFLDAFGRSPRKSVCACEISSAPSLSQALHLLNGDTVHKKIAKGGVVKGLLEAERTPAEIIDHLYRLCLTREPTSDERETLLAEVEGAEDARDALEDVFWALANSREFLFQH